MSPLSNFKELQRILNFVQNWHTSWMWGFHHLFELSNFPILRFSNLNWTSKSLTYLRHRRNFLLVIAILSHSNFFVIYSLDFHFHFLVDLLKVSWALLHCLCFIYYSNIFSEIWIWYVHDFEYYREFQCYIPLRYT